MSLESTLVALEAANTRLAEEVVLVKDVSAEAMTSAVAARDRAESAAQITESTRELMLSKFDDFSAIEQAVSESRENADTTAEDRLHVDQQTNHVNNQRAHLDAQRAHLDEQRSHLDDQRAHIDNQGNVVDTNTVQVRADATQVSEDRGVVESDRVRAESARLAAEELYGDLYAVSQASLAAKESQEAAAASAQAVAEHTSHVDKQVSHVDSQVSHVDSQVSHVDSQRSHIDWQKATVDQLASDVASGAAKVAADKGTVNTYKVDAQTAKTEAGMSRDESRAWATGDGIVGVLNGTNRYSARIEADRAYAQSQDAELSATISRDSANNAQNSALAAAMSESNANAHRIEAMKWASTDEDIEIAPGLFSAKHYMLKTRTLATGTLIYIGAWDASTGVFPTEFNPATGHFYKVSVAGVIDDEEFLVGDQIIYNGTDWDHIDNTERVTSVGGFIGDITDSQLLTAIKRVDGSGSGLDADLLAGKGISHFATATHVHDDRYLSLTGGTIVGQVQMNSLKITAGSGIGLGIAEPSTTYNINMNDAFAPNGTRAAIYSIANVEDGALTANRTHYGIFNSLRNDYLSEETFTLTQRGAHNEILNGPADDAAATINTAEGCRNYVLNRASGTINSAFGTYSHVQNSRAGATTSNAYGSYNYIQQSAGVITNAYAGYFRVDGTIASNSYGIYATGEDKNYFSGNVGIGTASPSQKLHVSGNILASGNITAYSDIRLKRDIEAINKALDKVCSLNGYTFERTDTVGPRQAGVIAQELIEVLPEAVIRGSDGFYSVAYGNIVALLIEAIKEERELRDGLGRRLHLLEDRMR